MIGAVTGLGPRTGTSFVMRKLVEANVPCFWTNTVAADQGNPEGYYETDMYLLPSLSNVVAKVWPGAHTLARIRAAVVLERNEDAQLASIAKQIEREGLPYSAEEVLSVSLGAFDGFKAENVLMVRTEELDSRIDEIIYFFREVGTWQLSEQSSPPLELALV